MYNTGNPVPSTALEDMADNAQTFDNFVNSSSTTTPNRNGASVKTRAGFEADHDSQMQSFEDDFDSRLAGMAFTRVGSFTSGATLADMRQVLVWEVSQGGDGHEYGWTGSFLPSGKVVPPSSTPETSGGIGAGAWVDRTDLTLRSDLGLIVKTYSSSAAMIADVELHSGAQCVTLCRFTQGDFGGARYIIKSSDQALVDGDVIDGWGSFYISGGLVAIIQESDIWVSYTAWGAVGDGVINDSAAIKSMYENSKSRLYYSPPGKTYMHDGSSIIVQQGSVTYLGSATLKLIGGTYTTNRFFFRNSDNINYNPAIARQSGIKFIGGTIDGNEANVTTVSCSTNAFWFHQCDNVTLDGVKIKNLAGDNGGESAIAFRFSNNCNVINPDIYNTDRQGVYFWESTGRVNGGAITLSRYREPILVSSENVVSYQGSNVEISRVKLNNVGTTSGTHVVRFSGKSSGYVKHCDLQGSTALDAVYITFGLEHRIEIENNDFRNCANGVKVDTSGDKIVTLKNNRYHACDYGINWVTNGVIESLNEKFYGTANRPISIDYAQKVTVKMAYVDGGSRYVFIAHYSDLIFDENTITNMSSDLYSVSIDSPSSNILAEVNSNKLYGNTNNIIRSSSNIFACNNHLDSFAGGGIRLGKIGSFYVWSNRLGVLYISGTLPLNDSDGTKVGSQS